MNYILLVSHGEMAFGTKKAAEMIAGPSISLDALCLTEDGDINFFKRELEGKLTKYSEEDNWIVVADLMGGSPYITVLECLAQKNILDKVFVLAGMNLSLVLSLMLAKDKLHKEEIKEMIQDSKKYICLFEKQESEEDL
ncbi:MAG: PTS sugar transporter subunit IIA [Anaerorhabdus sp.]